MDTLLIVDDEPSILEAYAHYLGPPTTTRVKSARVAEAPVAAVAPYRLLLASSAQQARELFDEERRQQRTISLGIFDMQMPGTDGFSLIRELREADPGLMCLVVTAFHERSTDELARYFGPEQDDWGYLAKPFHAAEIQQEVRSLVAAWHRRRSRTRELEVANAALEARTEELHRALAKAQAAGEAKSEFLAMMSHEIRTPMNGVLGMAQVLEQSSLTAEQRSSLSVIRESGEAMLTLLNDILDLSKIEAGKLELETRDFDLHDELKLVGDLFRHSIEERGLSFEVALDATLPQAVRGDSARLRQVLSNLLSNAMKFTRAGSVTLSARADVAAGRARLEFEVKDTGVGIAPARYERLFKAFSQVDSSVTREFGGSGLGLAICARLCSAMGGDIGIDSTPGLGTRCHFRVDFPLAEGPVQKAAPRAAVKHFPHLRVLVVEDNLVNRTVAKRLLEACGVTPEVAVNGKEAVEAACKQPFDLILMDMQMPVMDGLEATTLIRVMPLEHQPHIVALTANAFESDRRACLNAQMDGFLGKPLRLVDLQDVLERLG